MRLWRTIAACVSALGLIATLLVVLARWGGVRLGSFDVFYSSAVQEIVGISVLFLAGAVFYLADKVSTISAAAMLRKAEQSLSRQDVAVEDSDVEPPFPEPSPEITGDGKAKANSGNLIRISRLSKVYDLG